MKHKNDLKIKIDKEPRKKENILKRIVIIQKQKKNKKMKQSKAK